jgi:tetratricopeptide (TPR) repeat protein
MARSCKVAFIVLFVLLSASLVHAQEESREVYFDFGVFAYEDGDYEDAEANLKKALEPDPFNPLYNQYLGKTYMEMGRYEEARESLTRAWSADQDIPGLKYDMAFSVYKMEIYSSAAKLFVEITEEEPENVLAHYYAGVCLYKEADYMKAIDLFIAAADLSPSLEASGHLYAGMCYLKVEEFDKATEKLEHARDIAEQESLREQAIKWLDITRKQKRARSPFKCYIDATLMHDSNVGLDPSGVTGVKPVSDLVASIYLATKYNFVNRKDHTMGIGYTHFQNKHQDVSEQDLTMSALTLYTTYLWGPVGLGLKLIPDYSWVDGEGYMTNLELKPELTWKINDRLRAKLHWNYSSNNYLQDDGKDGDTIKLGARAYYLFQNKVSILSGGISQENKDADLDDEDYTYLKTHMELSIPIFSDFTLGAAGKYYVKNYYNDTTTPTKRKDNTYTLITSLAKPLVSDWLRVAGQVAYRKNKSTLSIEEYKKMTISLTLVANF